MIEGSSSDGKCRSVQVAYLVLSFIYHNLGISIDRVLSGREVIKGWCTVIRLIGKFTCTPYSHAKSDVPRKIFALEIKRAANCRGSLEEHMVLKPDQ